MKKVYDVVKQILIDHPITRNSDKQLLWKVWSSLGLNSGAYAGNYIRQDQFLRAPASESITRARRKIQELHPELQAVKPIREGREAKEATKGTFVFRETTQEKLV